MMVEVDDASDPADEFMPPDEPGPPITAPDDLRLAEKIWLNQHNQQDDE